MDKKVVLVSHGKLSEGVASAVEMVFGKNDALSYLGLAPDGDVVELIAGLKEEVKAHPDTQYVVLADIYGGSVCTQCFMQLNGLCNVHLIAGLSMPLALGVVSIPGALTDAQIAQAIADAKDGVQEVALSCDLDQTDDGGDDFF